MAETIDTNAAEAQQTGSLTDNSAADAAGTQVNALDALLGQDKTAQAELDRRISKALDTARSKWSQESAQQIEKAKTEAEKLARMTADQRAAHDREERENALTKREQDLMRRELRAEAAQEAARRGLPDKLLNLLDYTGADACKASLDAWESDFRAAVSDGIAARMKGSAPKIAQPQDNERDDELRRLMGIKTKT
jgi:DNA repair exonuclease SbcCD ATPase subunit